MKDDSKFESERLFKWPIILTNLAYNPIYDKIIGFSFNFQY